MDVCVMSHKNSYCIDILIFDEMTCADPSIMEIWSLYISYICIATLYVMVD
jgi:hypothetical protein